MLCVRNVGARALYSLCDLIHFIPRPIQTGHSSSKRSASLIAVAAGGEPPSTKLRDTDDLVANFAQIQQQDQSNKCAFD